MSIREIISELKKQVGMYRNANMLTNPERDWAVLLGAFIVFALTALIGSGYIFYAVGAGEFSASTGGDQQTIETIDQAQLQQTLQRFDTYEAAHQQRRQEAPSVIDPS